MTAYRIVEEALTNAAKHGKAARATVRVGISPEGHLSLAVTDDGTGFDSLSAPPGLGFTVMRDYSEAIGGRCEINGASGAGTEVVAVLPLSERPNETFTVSAS